jgi:hypothetical protein
MRTISNLDHVWICGSIKRKAFVGLRPSFSAHVRWGEHGAPVRFPPALCWRLPDYAGNEISSRLISPTIGP